MKSRATILISTVLLLTILSGCRKNDLFTEIHFGEAGGDSGERIDYTIDDDGGLYVTENGNTTFLKNIGKEKTKVIQDKLDELPASVWGFQHPFDVTTFLNVHTENGIRKAEWGDPDYPIATEAQDLYDYMMGLVN